MPSRFICHASLSTASPAEIETGRCLNCNRLRDDGSTHLPAERFRSEGGSATNDLVLRT